MLTDFPPVFVIYSLIWLLAHWTFCYNGAQEFPFEGLGSTEESRKPCHLSHSTFLICFRSLKLSCPCLESVCPYRCFTSSRKLALILPTLVRVNHSLIIAFVDHNSTSFLIHLLSLPDCELLWEHRLRLFVSIPSVSSMLPGMCWLFNNHLLDWFGLLWRWTRSRLKKDEWTSQK